MVVIRYSDADEDERLSGRRLERFIHTMRPTMVTVKVETRSNSCDMCYSASGTLVYDGAHIITCYHVFEC